MVFARLCGFFIGLWSFRIDFVYLHGFFSALLGSIGFYRWVPGPPKRPIGQFPIKSSLSKNPPLGPITTMISWTWVLP